MKSIKARWWGMPSTQRVALSLATFALIAAGIAWAAGTDLFTLFAAGALR